ncbi:hypothetical protein [Xylanimonas protaetiae]|uniref:Uncharacterized protein n=1 Tax=Xylanimonas protaetiae TaxID=2509457 RepID=A0A4V0YFW0_9MICO|nr:hypothetical protein [Xylanimonas protaetiae]QAY69081.1 hypothetical protein ET471_02660 [Xylanimonas protaetiae]
MHDLITARELADQSVELLPPRETLLFARRFSPVVINVSPVVAVNVGLALNAATIGSTAASTILQGLSLHG